MKNICWAAAAVFFVCSCASSPKNTVQLPPETESSVSTDIPLDSADVSAADNFASDEPQPAADDASLPEIDENAAALSQQENKPSAAQDFIPIFADDAVHSSQSALIDDQKASADDESKKTYSIISVPSADITGIEEHYNADVITEKTENHAPASFAELDNASKPSVHAGASALDAPLPDPAPKNSSVPQKSGAALADNQSKDVVSAAADNDTEEISDGRSVKKGQIIDIYCSGQGWAFTKKTGDTRAVSYSGKKRSGDDTIFSFFSKEQGVISLHFSRSDPLSGKKTDYLVDIQVTDVPAADSNRLAIPFDPLLQTVAEAPAEKNAEEHAAERAGSLNQPDASDSLPVPEKNTSVPRENETLSQTAPDLSSAVMPFAEDGTLPEQPISKTAAADIAADPAEIQASQSETDPLDSLFSIRAEPDVEIIFPSEDFDKDPVQSSDISADELLDEAAVCYENKEYSKALSLLEQFFAKSVRRLDEGWFLRGQIYEAENKQGNIKRAFDAYTLLVSNYPGSALWKKASERIIYLNRFYFNIR